MKEKYVELIKTTILKQRQLDFVIDSVAFWNSFDYLDTTLSKQLFTEQTYSIILDQDIDERFFVELTIDYDNLSLFRYVDVEYMEKLIINTINKITELPTPIFECLKLGKATRSDIILNLALRYE